MIGGRSSNTRPSLNITSISTPTSDGDDTIQPLPTWYPHRVPTVCNHYHGFECPLRVLGSRRLFQVNQGCGLLRSAVRVQLKSFIQDLHLQACNKETTPNYDFERFIVSSSNLRDALGRGALLLFAWLTVSARNTSQKAC
jgi:hypothetical protein